MLTSKIDNSNFLVGGNTYKAGDVISLTEPEANKLREIVALVAALNTAKPKLYDDCFVQTSPYNQTLAIDFYAFEKANRDYTYLVGSLIHDVCARLGGLIPLRIQTDGQGSVIVREITDENESVILTTDIVRRASKFDRTIGDARLFLGNFIATSLNEGISRMKCRSANWALMGAPYLTAKNEFLPFAFDYADRWTSFSWSDVENSDIDKALMTALQAVLSADKRLEMMKSGAWPFTAMTIIVGEKEILILNTGELPTDEARLQLTQREITRLGAKYLFMLHFGQINKGGSTHDFDNEEMQKQPPVGFTLSMMMRSENAESLLLGGKAWRLLQTPKGVTMQICASYENHPGIGDVNGKAIADFLFANVSKPKLSLVK